jgi:hypothetical protein
MDEVRPLTPQLARALIRSLNRGTAVAEGARFIHVGQNEWLAAQLEMLGEVGEDGHAETKFVRGAYGAGKSHFLSIVQDYARERGWVTAHIECKTDNVEIDRFETLYPRILAKLLFPASAGSGMSITTGMPVDPTAALLEKWSKKVMRGAGIRENALSRPFDADQRVYGYFERELFRSSLPTQFIHGTLAYCRAVIENDLEVSSATVAWLKGGTDTLRIPAHYIASPRKPRANAPNVAYRAIGKGTANDAMRAILWLIHDAGFTGLVLCIDEIEELARFGSQRRQDQALQALREFVDHAGGEGGYHHLCMYLAATPEMFDSERYFLRYDALATRIQPLGDTLNWRGPVVDLDRKPLSALEMTSIGEAIARVYAIAYGNPVPNKTAASIVATAVDGALASRQRLAKPRLLARMLVDELERARSEGSSYCVPADVGAAASRAATSVLNDAGT